MLNTPMAVLATAGVVVVNSFLFFGYYGVGAGLVALLLLLVR